MKTKYRWNISFTLSEFHLFSFFVILIHVGVLMSTVNFDPYENLSEEEKEKIAKLKEEKKEEELSIQERLKRRRKTNYFGITYLGNVDLKNKSRLSHLLSKNIVKTEQSFDNQSNLYQLKESKGEEVPLSKNIEFTEKELNEYTLSLLKKNKPQYKKCYYKFQQKDDLLEGYVDLKVNMGNGQVRSAVKFQGVGQKSIVKQLESCIIASIEAISFPAILNGKKYKLKVIL